jgi:uncharacterized membrane protein YkvA (DUF1232 family)
LAAGETRRRGGTETQLPSGHGWHHHDVTEWWLVPVGIAAGLVLIWLALIVSLWTGKPDDVGLRDAVRLLPDLLQLLKRLAADSTMPRGVRIRIALLMVYLAWPLDLIPDIMPVIGYADGIIVAMVLRSVTRVAGVDALAKHWPGTPEGLDAVYGLCRLQQYE